MSDNWEHFRNVRSEIRQAGKMDLLNEIMELVDNSLENIVEPHAIEYAQSFKDQLLDIRDRLNGGDDG